MDLHIHTPGSNDYQEPDISYLDILRQAELRGLDIIAFTDHNTVAGYVAMMQQINDLRLLQRLGRMAPDEERLLETYEKLLSKLLVLPGFEFTATFGFHILALFPPDTDPAYLEHLLLTLRVPLDQLRTGSSTVGATTDVITAYRILNEAGALVIAAHANSSNGVFMRDFAFGGQTRIAYTQDPNLHALEVTDLEKRSRHTTQRFFNGSKPEYPRAMRCIQGSDSHRLVQDPGNPKYLGIGDRVTEILLPELSFAALAKVIKGTDLSLTRPFRGKAPALDFVQAAQEQGESLVQAFRPNMAARGGNLRQILCDICAMANTNGGTIYVGATPEPKQKPEGVRNPTQAIKRLQDSITKHLSPEPDVNIDILKSGANSVVRITVAPGRDLPYSIDQSEYYVRDETETNLAVRDELVQLIERGLKLREVLGLESAIEVLPETKPPVITPTKKATEEEPPIPRTGVEIVDSEKRGGTLYHTVRDLRNDNLIKNVTRSSARKLWHYAITQQESGEPKMDKIRWQGNMAVLGARKRDDNVWYDLALKQDGNLHVYYGVTDSGLNDMWLKLIEQENI
ncbi:MAG: putative DNA binding domain-containing protein [Anaerolineales bacterium]|nr:putative DNA binding domain-containing protein [Anaerolineales bacterium]MCB8959793.1 putative DNA binding domain-containing protein [Ardenticatenales bacterium]